MALHHMIDGKRVDCSREEESEIRSQWKINEDQASIRRQDAEVGKNKKAKDRQSGMDKLKQIGGLSDEEIAALLP